MADLDHIMENADPETFPKPGEPAYGRAGGLQFVKELEDLACRCEVMIGYACDVHPRFDELRKRFTAVREARDRQGRRGNWDWSPYMHGMYNALELALATLENREPVFREAPAQWGKDQ